MKKNVLLIAALLMFSASLSAVAKEDPSNEGFAVVPVKGSNVYKVIYKNENGSRVKLNVYNSAGQVIFSETMSKGGFIQPLNLSGLEAGEYTVEINDGASKQSEKIAYNLTTASTPATEKIVHVSKVSKAEEKFILSIANVNSESFDVKIFGTGDNLIFSETTSVAGSNAKMYHVKNQKVSRIEVTDSFGKKSVKRF
jgi:hypothetical protein